MRIVYLPDNALGALARFLATVPLGYAISHHADMLRRMWEARDAARCILPNGRELQHRRTEWLDMLDKYTPLLVQQSHMWTIGYVLDPNLRGPGNG